MVLEPIPTVGVSSAPFLAPPVAPVFFIYIYSFSLRGYNILGAPPADGAHSNSLNSIAVVIKGKVGLHPQQFPGPLQGQDKPPSTFMLIHSCNQRVVFSWFTVKSWFLDSVRKLEKPPHRQTIREATP